MGRSKHRCRAHVVALVAASLAFGCDEHAAKPHRSAAPTETIRPTSVIPEPAVPTAVASAAAPEGADTAEAVFARAQTLLEGRDFISLVYTIRPETRRRWTADLVVALALESIDDGTDSDIGRRSARAHVRRLLSSFGATASVDHGEVNVRALAERLFERVHDPDGLLAAMLAFADMHGCGLDPLCALAPSGIDGVVTPDESHKGQSQQKDPLLAILDAGIPKSLVSSGHPSVSVPASGIVRLFDRVRGQKLHEVHFTGESGVGMTDAPEFLPIRFYTSNGVTWLDES